MFITGLNQIFLEIMIMKRTKVNENLRKLQSYLNVPQLDVTGHECYAKIFGSREGYKHVDYIGIHGNAISDDLLILVFDGKLLDSEFEFVYVEIPTQAIDAIVPGVVRINDEWHDKIFNRKYVVQEYSVEMIQ